MITLHHLEHSRSQRILWLLEELGTDYEVQRYQRDPKTSLAPPELRSIHPLGKSPVITDGERVLAESATIIEYLARSYGGGNWAPSPDDPAYWQFSYWMHFAEGSLMPPLLLKLVFTKVRTASPLFVRPVAAGIAAQVDRSFTDPQIRTHFTFVDAHLAEHEWFAGEAITAADIQMSFPLEAATARGTVDESTFPHIFEYVRRFQARPAYQRALEVGGDYDYGPA